MQCVLNRYGNSYHRMQNCKKFFEIIDIFRICKCRSSMTILCYCFEYTSIINQQ